MTDPPAVPGPDAEAEWYRRRRAERDSLPMPAGFHLTDDEETGIEVRFPVVLWSPLHGDFRSLKRALYLLFLAPWLLVALSGFGARAQNTILFVLVVALLVVPLFGLILRRFVAVRAEGVEVGWWPLPLSSRRLVAREIRGVFVRQRDAPMEVSAMAPDRRDEAEFDIWIDRADGRQERFVGSLTSSEHALWLEAWLERRLGIGEARAAAQSATAGAGGGAEGS